MSITYPTFIDKEIVTHTKLNAFVDDIEAKFTAGIGTADIQWPLYAGDNLVMGAYEIEGASKIFKIVNAAEYDTLALACAAANSEGTGGVVFIPPSTTVQSDGGELTGAKVAIIGSGPSSVLKIADTPALAYLVRNKTADGTVDVLVANLTLDGNSEAGTATIGLDLRYTKTAIVHGVWFKNFEGPLLKVSSASEGLQITDCHFTGGAAEHILVDACRRLYIQNCISDTCDTDAFSIVGGAVKIRQLHIVNNIVRTCDEVGINVDAGTATVNATVTADFVVCDNQVDGGGAVSANTLLIVGTDAKKVTNAVVHGNIITNAPGDGLVVNSLYGSVCDNIIPGAAAAGIDMSNSSYMLVHDNMCYDAGTYGIDIVSTDGCIVHDNIVDSAGSTGINFTTGTGSQHDNSDIVGKTISAFVNMDHTSTSAGGKSSGSTVTIPANFLQVGDLLCIEGEYSHAGDGTDGRARIHVAGQTTASCLIDESQYGHLVVKAVLTEANSLAFFHHGVYGGTNVGMYIGNWISGGADVLTIDETTAIDIEISLEAGASNTPATRGLVVQVYKADDQGA